MPDTEVMPHSFVEPFSLYLDLEPGQYADLESISSIGLALSLAIKEAAFIIDPSITLRTEIVRGREGSYSFDTILRAVNAKDLLARLNLKSIAAACLIWFGGQSAEYTYQKVLDHLLASPIEISEADREDIAKKVADILQKKIALDRVQAVYKAVHAEPAIQGIGATQNHTTRPTHIIPRSEFPHRAGARSETEVKATSRIREKKEALTLISPVLLEDSPRRWRVIGAEGEFGASVKDEGFLKSLTHGKVKVPMVANIQLVVLLQTKEEFHDGAWKVNERNILKVYQVIPPHTQANLSLN
jgi:hypothetical protein